MTFKYRFYKVQPPDYRVLLEDTNTVDVENLPSHTLLKTRVSKTTKAVVTEHIAPVVTTQSTRSSFTFTVLVP